MYGIPFKFYGNVNIAMYYPPSQWLSLKISLENHNGLITYSLFPLFLALLAFTLHFENGFPQRSFASNEFDNRLTFDFLPILSHLMWLVELHST